MKCEVCDNEFVGTWTDFYGEQTCLTCGAPYQLLEPSGAKPGLTYPCCCLKDEFIPILREYYQETKRRVRLGTFLLPDDYPGLLEERKAFREWLQLKHAEWLPVERTNSL